jgi:hypothetical protein
MVWKVAVFGFGTSLPKLTHGTFDPFAKLQTDGGVAVPPLELEEEDPPPELDPDDEPPLELELEWAPEELEELEEPEEEEPLELELDGPPELDPPLELEPELDVPPVPASLAGVVPPELELGLPPPPELDEAPDPGLAPELPLDPGPASSAPPPSSKDPVSPAEQAAITATAHASANDERKAIDSRRSASRPTRVTIVVDSVSGGSAGGTIDRCAPPPRCPGSSSSCACSSAWPSRPSPICPVRSPSSRRCRSSSGSSSGPASPRA